MNETVRISRVGTDDRTLTVSTIRLGHRRYDTVVFDSSLTKALAGRTVGRWVIDKSSVWSDTREEALDVHRAAVETARTEPLGPAI